MSSSNQTPDMSRIIGDLSKQISKLVDSMEGGRSGSSGAGRAKKDDGGLGTISKSSKALNEALKDVNKNLDALNSGAKDVAKSHEKLYTAQTTLLKGMVSAEDKSKAQHEKLAAKINNSIKAQSVLGINLDNTAKSTEHLNKIIEETGEFLHTYADLLKKTNAQSLAGITDADKQRDALLKLQKSMDLGAEVNDLINKKQYDAASKRVDADAKNAAMVRNEITKTTTNFNVLTNVTNGLGKGMTKAADAIGLGFVKEALEGTAGLSLLVGGAKEAYTQFKSVASSGFGREFINLSGTAISLGISLEALTKITKENMNLVGKMGLDGFNDSLKESQKQLMGLGLSTEEAAKTKASITENAFLTGVDVSNKKELNKSTQEQIAQYETLRATTGESIDKIAEQTKAILQSNDSMKIMSAMTKSQRGQMLQDINLERARLTAMGLSNDAAMEVVKTVQSMSNEKATTRLGQANNIQAAGATVGMDAAFTDKISQIMLKSKGSRTKEDEAALADYAKQYNQKSAAMQGDGSDIGQQIVGDYADEMAGPMKELGEKMAGANMDRGLTKDQIESNKAMGRLPAAVTDGMSKLESALKFIESPAIEMAAGVVGIFMMLKQWKKNRAAEAKSAIGSAYESEKTAGINGGKSVAAKPGDSIQGSTRFNSQMDHIAKKSGWKEQGRLEAAQGSGFSGMNKVAGTMAEDAAAKKAASAGKGHWFGQMMENNTSIGSATLQEKLAANKARLAGPTVGNNLPSHTIPESFGSKLSGGIRGAGSKVGGAAKGLATKGIGAITEGIGSIAKFGAKAIPFLGWAIAGVDAIVGAFNGVDQAATIFGKEANKDALTTSEKVSAGIAGALNTLSFGFIPLDSTAKLLNDVAEQGVGVITDYMEEFGETVFNKVIPAIWDGFKSMVGFLGSSIADIFTGGSDGTGGFIGGIMTYMREAIELMVVSMMKGIVKVGADIMDSITSHLPKWMVPDSMQDLGKKNTWASSDTHMSDFDNPEEAAAREKRKDAKAKRDGKPGEKVQGTATGEGSDITGMQSDYNQALTDDQLAAQGIQGKPSSTNAPGVTPASAGTTDANGNVVNNNTTNNTTTAPPQSESEKILSSILDKMTALVDLTSKGIDITADAAKTQSTLARTSSKKEDGYAPSMSSFMNMA